MRKTMNPTDDKKERIYAQTGDGWRIALWRYRADPSGGEGRLPALLAPGYPSDHRVFDPTSGRPGLSPFLAGVGRETWVLEVRTMGDSHPLEGEADRPWSLDHFLSDLLAALDKMKEVLGPAKVHLAGHSYGGFLIHHALVSPWGRRVASATTIASPAFSALPLGIFLKPLAPPLLRALAALPVEPLKLTLLPPRLGLKLYSRLRPGKLVYGLPPHVAEYLLDKCVSRAVGGIMLDYARWIEGNGPESAAAGNLEEGFSRVKTPFQCIGGCADPAGEESFRRLVDLVGSDEKRLVLAGKAAGFSRDYGHDDLVLGPLAHREISPLVEEWMRLHDG